MHAHRFAFCPSAPPRQAELRISSWLAPSRTSWSCDHPAWKTRDASDRCLPPIRICCTHTSRVPGSLSPLSRRGRPTESLAPHGRTGGPDVFTTPETASADHGDAVTSGRAPHGLLPERGLLLPTASTMIEPLTSLSRCFVTLTPPPPSRELHLAVPSAFGLGTRVGGCAVAPRPPVSPPRERMTS